MKYLSYRINCNKSLNSENCQYYVGIGTEQTTE